MKNYDVIIIGGGPAGLTAGIYCARARLKTLIVEQAIIGGQIALTSEVENYPGFPEVISGMNLGRQIETQAKKFGVEIQQAIVSKIDLLNKTIDTGSETIQAKAIILAMGSEAKKLGLPGEDEFRGRGVSYCATCDGNFFRDKVVAVVGGGNSAVEEALYLSKIASKVLLIHRRKEFRAVKILQEKAQANSKIKICTPYVPVEIKGAKLVEGIVLKNVETNALETKELSAVFFYAGQNPNTSLIKGQCLLDSQ
ncbi:MAG: FAD-dependent oxidoreductase, partial [Candidatus Margulisiibacteriota bacterium]